MKKIKNNVIKVGKKATLYIKNLLKFVGKHKNTIVISFLSLLLAGSLGFGIYKYLTTPRAPNLKTAKGSYLYAAKGLDFTAFIGNKENNRPDVTFTVGSGSVVFTPASGNEKPSTPSADGKKAVIFKDVYSNIDFRYQTIPLGVKEEIIVKKATPIRTFPFFLDFNGVTPEYLTDNIKGTAFFDKDGKYLFNFEKPFAIDAKGVRNDSLGISIKKDTPTGKYVAIITIDNAWMNDPSRAYPITIDPTIVHDTTSEFATGQMNRVKDTGSGSSPNLETYYQELGTDPYTAGLWHMNEASGNILDSSGNSNTGIPTGTTVVSGQTGFGNARSFNGSSDKITFSDPVVGTNFSVEMWVKPNTNIGNTNQAFFDTKPAALGALRIYGSGAGALLFETGGSTALSATIGDWTNQWHHIAFVLSSSTRTTLYIDGVEANTGVNTYAGSSNTFILGNYNSTNWFNGTIDEVRISNIARSAEEIALDAFRRPYSTFTSDVIDLTNVTSWNSLSWTGTGFATGDGETATSSATSNLVAQWNFNETSGTTAVSGGTCGTSCNGTLTSFASTGSQDAAPSTGWTANNRRWGAGALMFDGTDDYVNVGDPASLKITGQISVESWIKTTDTSFSIVSKDDVATNRSVGFDYTSSNLCLWIFNTPSVYNAACSTLFVPDGMWHHVVGTYTPSTSINLYLDGKLISSTTTSVPSSINNNTVSWNIGGRATYPSSPIYFNGVMDSPKIYNRVLSASEILSNYNSSRVELQTRVGDSADPNDGTWEAWKPVTNETQISSNDGYLYPTNSTGLVSYWPMDETSGTTVYDRAGTNNGTSTGTTIGNYGVFGNDQKFAGTSGSYVNVGDPSSLDITGDFSIMGWVRLNSVAAGTLVSKTVAGTTGGYAVLWGNQGEVYCRTNNGTTYTDSYTALGQLTVNTWVHVAAVRSGTSCRVYINGVDKTSVAGSHTNPAVNALNLMIGARSDLGAEYTNGQIDEVRIYNTALTASQVQQLAIEGSTSPNTIREGTDSNTKIEGTGATRIQTGPGVPDYATVGLWHLDETGGAGAYLKDAAGTNHATPNGTTLIDGINGKGRSFNGTSDYAYVSASPIASVTNWTLEGWIKPSNLNQIGLAVYNGNDSGGYGFGIGNGSGVAGSKLQVLFGTVAWIDCGYTFPSANQWYHVVITRDTTTTRCYVNGTITANTSTSTPGTVQAKFSIGMEYNSSNSPTQYFTGAVDEVRVSSIARSAEEIAEAYRMGRDHRVSETISSTNLSSATKLPFYVASDRLGTFMQMTYGESSFANYETDSNTAGLWHMDEASGSGAFIKDASGNSNNGTPTGTAFAQGKIGKGRYFNGSSYIQVPASDSMNSLGGASSSYTVGIWFNTTTAADQSLTEKWTGSTYPWAFRGPISTGTSGSVYFALYDGTNNPSANSSTGGVAGLNDGKWHYAVGVRDVSADKVRLYIDGKLVDEVTDTTTASMANSGVTMVGARNGPGNYFTGILDEFRVDNIARTSDEIRQAYEIGARTHNVTIDFKAKLASGNLITGSGDYSFTVDETAYGSSAMANHLFSGDKIIVKENYDGTEYIAQGTVNGVNSSTGAVTVSSWDTGSTFPSGGFTVNATVFKWQREYFDITGILSFQKDALTRLTYRITDGSQGANIWLDDLRSNTGYLTTPGGSTIPSSTGKRYFQYRTILSQSNLAASSAALTSVTLNYVSNYAPNTPSLDLPANGATGVLWTPQLKTTTVDLDSDYLQYKIILCKDVGMSVSCQTFDQSVSQTGWSGQNTQSSTAYNTGTQATYTVQTALDIGTTYYWKSYAIDPAGTNTWSVAQSTPNSFTTLAAPLPASNCRIQETSNDTSLTVVWDDNATNENAYEVQRSVDGAAFSTLHTGLAANTVTDADSSITEGHTYQYRVAPYFTGPSYAPWCTTSTLSLQLGEFSVKGLDLKGLNLK